MRKSGTMKAAARKLNVLAEWVGTQPYSGLPWLVAAYIFGCCLVYTQTGPFSGRMIGFDDQVRMVQVLNLVNGTGWYNHTLMRADPPGGFETIWARIVDIPLAIAVLVGQLFVSQKVAALATSVIVTFAELIVLFFAARYAARPLVGKKDSWLIVLFLMFTSVVNWQQYTFAGFHLGEASHHSWYIILNALMTGATARIALGTRGNAAIGMLALAVAVFLAVGIEGFPLIAGTAGVLGAVAWLFSGHDLACRAARGMAGGALLGLALLPIDQPLDKMFNVSFSHPSILGPVLVGCAAAFLFAETYILRSTGPKNKVLGLLGMAIVAGLLAALVVEAFPKILQGPAAALSPAERKLAAAEHPEAWMMFDVLKDTSRYIAMLAPSLIALLGGIVAMKSAKSRRRRMMYATTFGLAALTAGMAQWFWRYIHHALVSTSLWLLWMWQGLKRRLPKNKHYSLASLGLFLALGPFWMLLLPVIANDMPFTSQVLLYPAKIYDVPDVRRTCDPLGIAQYLDKHYPPSTNLIVPDFDSASFLFQTGLTIDFLANFPSQDKFIANKLFFETQDTDSAKKIAAEHNIDLVASCSFIPLSPEMYASRPYRKPIMFERLRDGDVPMWLKPVYTGVETNYRLYRVDKNQMGSSTAGGK